MKAIKAIFVFILVLIVAKVAGHFAGRYIATDGGQDQESAQQESLRMFLNEFVVNNANFQYPIKIDERTYLTSRSLEDDGGATFVVENYKFTAPVSSSPTEIRHARNATEEHVIKLFCSKLQQKEMLFSGYSSVGLIQSFSDSNGKHLFKIKIDKSQCM